MKCARLLRSTLLSLVLLLSTNILCRGFTILSQQPISSYQKRGRLFECNLVPLSQYESEITFFSKPADFRCCLDENGRFHDAGEVYLLSLVQEDDLSDVARFVVEAFGADAIRLSQELNMWERSLIQPAAELLNSYTGIVAFAEVLAGMRSRLRGRLGQNREDIRAPNVSAYRNMPRSEKIQIASNSSLVLVLAKPRSRSADKGRLGEIDVIGSVELRLQPCDAKIPFSLPWIDHIERKLASILGLKGTQYGEESARDLQPYLSNLCVDEKYRGRSIGRALVRCVEDIASSKWKYSRMYLHVDIDNRPALELYRSEGYRDVGIRWMPFWAGKAADIGYFCKDL